MSGRPTPRPIRRGGGVPTTALFGVAVGFLGLLTGVPFYLGPAIGGLGVAASAVWRARRPAVGESLPLVPALAAVTALAATAPVAPASELFAGLAALAFLLWVADDPARPAGGGRRAAATIGPAALGIGSAWGVTLALTGRTAAIGVGAGLVAIGLVVLAVLFSLLSPRPPEPAPAGPEL